MAKNFEVIMLASGSKGNAALISTENRRFLVDVGISCRELSKRLKSVGVAAEDIDYVFLTHEHIDHIRGLSTFMKKYSVPVFASYKTWLAIFSRDSTIERAKCNIIDKTFLAGGVRVDSFPVPHDAVDTRGFVFTAQGSGAKCTYVTDVGFVTPLVREAAEGSTELVLEANHDIEMLRNGPYPYLLKQRIAGGAGHLSNIGAASMLAAMERLPAHVFLAHLSQHNNRPELAYATAADLLDSVHRLGETEIIIASQDEVVTDNRLRQQDIFAAEMQGKPLFK